MRRWKLMLTVMLVTVWSLASVHCDLEHLPGFQFLACDTQEAASHADNDCEGDSCAQVEDGLYKSVNSRFKFPAASVFTSFIPAPRTETPQPDPIHSLGSRELLPPDLPVNWQFALRAALPPRAPSLAS